MENASRLEPAPGSPPPEVAKRAYAKPQLVRFGDVRVLTMNNTQTFLSEDSAPGHSGCNKSNGRLCVSDRRFKQDLASVGRHPWGFDLYLFRFKPEYRDTHGHGLQFGVMADEVERVAPQAVFTLPAGHKVVDYDALGIRREPLAH